MSAFARTLAASALTVGVALGSTVGTAVVTSPGANAAPSYCSKPSSELTAAQRAICGQTTTTRPSTNGLDDAFDPMGKLPSYQTELVKREVESVRSQARWGLAIQIIAFGVLGPLIYTRFRRDNGLPAFGGGAVRGSGGLGGAFAEHPPIAPPTPPSMTGSTVPPEPVYVEPPATDYPADEVFGAPPEPTHTTTDTPPRASSNPYEGIL